jgi:hypothetical protein
MSETVAILIDAEGGPAAFAEKVNKSAGAVRLWKHRNQIPRRAWPDVLDAFPGVTMDRLKAVEAASKSVSRSTVQAA